MAINHNRAFGAKTGYSILFRVCVLAALIIGVTQAINTGWLSQQLSVLLLQPSDNSLQFKTNSVCDVQIAAKTGCSVARTGGAIDTTLRVRLQAGPFIGGRNGLSLSVTVGGLYVQPDGLLYSQAAGDVWLNGNSQIVCDLQAAGTCPIPTLPNGLNKLSNSAGESTTIWAGEQTGIGSVQLATGAKADGTNYVVVPVLWTDGRVVSHLPSHVLSAFGAILATGAPPGAGRHRAIVIGEGIIVLLVALECSFLLRSIASDLRLWHGLVSADCVPKNNDGHWVQASESEHMPDLVERTFGNLALLPRVMAWNLNRRQPPDSAHPMFVLRHAKQPLPEGALIWVPTIVDTQTTDRASRRQVLWSARIQQEQRQKQEAQQASKMHLRAALGIDEHIAEAIRGAAQSDAMSVASTLLAMSPSALSDTLGVDTIWAMRLLDGGAVEILTPGNGQTDWANNGQCQRVSALDIKNATSSSASRSLPMLLGWHDGAILLPCRAGAAVAAPLDMCVAAAMFIEDVPEDEPQAGSWQVIDDTVYIGPRDAPVLKLGANLSNYAMKIQPESGPWNGFSIYDADGNFWLAIQAAAL